MDTDLKVNIIQIEDIEGEFKLIITEEDNLWQAEGKLTNIMVTPAKDFRDIYNKKISLEIKDFL